MKTAIKSLEKGAADKAIIVNESTIVSLEGKYLYLLHPFQEI